MAIQFSKVAKPISSNPPDGSVNIAAVPAIVAAPIVNDLPPLGEHLKMVGVRMNQAEVEAIDKARGKVSRQDFIRKAALWLADQAEKLG